ncbi:MAG: rubrerythrin family protein [Lachnospirales bacterium]
MDFKTSQTKENLMRAFAGESQARNRYVFSAKKAENSELYVVSAIFNFTASQEQTHAEAFYNKLKEVSDSNIDIEGNYPVNIYDDVVKMLRAAQHNEFQEFDNDYKNFSETAREEGFMEISALFNNIANVEKTHGDRFARIADLLEQDKLFISDTETKWVCLNCGYVTTNTKAPLKCPVCNVNRGYFIRIEMMPYM